MKRRKILRRFLPGIVVQLLYLIRDGAFVSHRAEVEWSKNAKFGPGTVVSSFTKIKVTDGKLVTGKRVQIGPNCFLGAGLAGLTIGDDVLFGPGAAVFTSNYVYNEMGVPLQSQGQTSKGVTILDRAWIGGNATVLDGVTIGRDAIIVAGAVVTSNVPDGGIAQGNPAQVVFTRR